MPPEGSKQGKSYSPNGFYDASKKAYAAVVYFVAMASSSCLVKLGASKIQVSPLQKQTIPRSELLSALLLARLMTAIARNLEGELSVLWPTCYTDSNVALYWILCVGRDWKGWKQFVLNRASEIRKLLLTDCWTHYPASENPADLTSKGSALTELLVSKLWQQGPEWFKQPDRIRYSLNTPMPEDCTMEMKQRINNKFTVCLPLISRLV